MGLFHKKKEETSCCCGSCTPERMVDAERAKTAAGVKVLGGGCAKCNALEAAVRSALEELGMDTAIDHVTDFSQIAAYGVMSTPALVVDGKVVSYGKRCGFSKRYFLVLVACRHLTCTKTECRKMFLSLIAPLTTIRLNRGKRSNRLPYIFAQGQER